MHDIELSEPRVRFVTRDRMQRFIDSMAFGSIRDVGRVDPGADESLEWDLVGLTFDR